MHMVNVHRKAAYFRTVFSYNSQTYCVYQRPSTTTQLKNTQYDDEICQHVLPLVHTLYFILVNVIIPDILLYMQFMSSSTIHTVVFYALYISRVDKMTKFKVS